MAWFSNNRIQPSFDFGRRFGNNNEWGIRVGGLFRKGDTPRAGYDEQTHEFALGADYRGERLSVALDVLNSRRKTNGARSRIQDIQNLNFQLPSAPDGSTNIGPSWSGQTTEDTTVMLTFGYDISDSLYLSGGIGHMYSKYYGDFGNIGFNPSNREEIRFQAGALRDYTIKNTSANLKLQGDLYTGNIHHDWSIAWDSVIRTRHFLSGPTGTDSTGTYLAVRTNYTDLYNPNYGSRPYYRPLEETPGTDEKVEAHSLALADSIGFFDDKLKIILGGRLQYIKQHNKKDNEEDTRSRFSPMIAASYSFTPNHMVYANYLQDLEPGSFDEEGSMAPPVVSTQYEIGIRNNWSEQFTTTLSLFQIERPSTIPDRNTYKNNGYTVGAEQGKERNRGIELNLYGSFFNKTLRPNLGITYMHPLLINFPTWNNGIQTGEQVASPRVIAKFNLDWDTPIPELSLNAGVQYYGKSYQDYAKRYAFPSYTTVDIGAKYALKLSEKEQITFRAGIENLFNEKYWQVQRGRYDRSFAVLGMPRTYWLSAKYTF